MDKDALLIHTGITAADVQAASVRMSRDKLLAHMQQPSSQPDCLSHYSASAQSLSHFVSFDYKSIKSVKAAYFLVHSPAVAVTNSRDHTAAVCGTGGYFVSRVCIIVRVVS